jgi:3-deoxy-D-manno-octulosonate 8-phosphate phosphatase (KDO 8-P phosphatase)
VIDPALAKSIKLVAFDVDGVLTDGGIYLGDVDGRRLEFKRYDIQDGLGIFMLKLVDIPSAIITGRVSESVRLRAAELGVAPDDVAQNSDGHKLEGFMRMLERRRLSPEEVAFLGDDFPDMPLLRIVGLPVAVGNAVPEIDAVCRHHLTKSGGRGAAREFVEDFLKARGEWDLAWQRYVDARSTVAGRAGVA